MTHFPCRKKKIKRRRGQCSFSFGPYGDSVCLRGEWPSRGAAGPLADRDPPCTCRRSGRACLCQRLARGGWAAALGERRPGGRATMQPRASRSLSRRGGHARAAHGTELKGATCLASEFEKRQSSVHRQRASPDIAGFSSLTAPVAGGKLEAALTAPAAGASARAGPAVHGPCRRDGHALRSRPPL